MWTLGKAHQAGELVAAIAVVLSLLFVGYELQQNNRRQVQATTQELVNAYTDIGTLMSQHADLRCAYAKGIRDFSSLSGTEALAFSAYLVSLWRLREDLYFQYLDGSVNPEIWSGFEAATREVMQYPGFQQWFEFRRHWFSERFQAYIDGMMGPPADVVPFDDPACSVDG